MPQEGSRGRILDRRGEVIAGNKLCYDLLIMAQDKEDIDRTLDAVSRVLGKSPAQLRASLRTNFIAAFAPVVIARDIERRQAIALEEMKSEFDNIIVQPRPVRLYLSDNLACHLLGYLNEIDHWRLTKLEEYGYQTKDVVGFGGVEEKYDYYMRPEKGGFQIEVDHRGRFIRVLGFRPPVEGKDINLTIDLRIQKIVETHLRDRPGSVVIMDPSTGEIIAMASWPNFDPAVFLKQNNSLIGNLFNDPKAPLINRAISGVYPLGSVFKLVVATAALETSKINLTKTFFCPGFLRVGRREVKCWNNHGAQNLMAAITHSCDVFFYNTGLSTGPQALHDYALRFGFSKATGIDLPYESVGQVPSPMRRRLSRQGRWYDGDTANFSIGQGDLLVTPLQVARMTAVFANGGRLVRPYIVMSVQGRDISVSQRQSVPTKLKQWILDYVAKSMREVVRDPSGTGNVLSSAGVEVAGKTGTVQVPRGLSHGWFSGFFPYQHPKYVISVFLEHGGSGQASCQLARHIIEDMVKEGLL